LNARAEASLESVFLREGDRVTATAHGRGPWDPQALHGGAPAALLAAAFEAVPASPQLSIARLDFAFLRPIPLVPLRLRTRVVRTGRRVQELAAELTMAAGGGGEGGASGARARRVDEGTSGDGEVVCRASALRVLRVAEEVAPPSAEHGVDGGAPAALPGPQAGTVARFSLDGSTDASFATTAMEIRWLSEPWALGPAQVWMRLRRPLIAGQPTSPVARLAAAADFGNGVSATLPFERYLFINADLTIHLQRPPRGEWIGLDARTLVRGGGTGLAESVLHDEHGTVGRAFQTLVVQPR
jgi:acyl-coenzyme A thioesterase PaaI-like protein